jgi:hypothetical protein
MTIFHRHTYDGSKWKKDNDLAVTERHDIDTWFWTVGPVARKLPESKVVEKRVTYTNTCLTCGDLTSKTIVT